MSIHEPTTFLTDLLLGGSAIVWGALLLFSGRSAARRLWALGMIVTGAGAIAGGTWHAVAPELAPGLAAALWKATMLAVGAGAWLMASGYALAVLRPAGARVLLAIAAIQYGLYALLCTQSDSFSLVIGEYGLALLAITGFALADLRRDRARASLVLSAAGISVLAAIVQAAGLAPHPSFNHNDLYHVIQVAAMWCLYRGGRRLGGDSQS